MSIVKPFSLVELETRVEAHLRSAVAVLSNLSQEEDIPATTIGFKKLLELSSVS